MPTFDECKGKQVILTNAVYLESAAGIKPLRKGCNPRLVDRAVGKATGYSGLYKDPRGGETTLAIEVIFQGARLLDSLNDTLTGKVMIPVKNLDIIE